MPMPSVPYSTPLASILPFPDLRNASAARSRRRKPAAAWVRRYQAVLVAVDMLAAVLAATAAYVFDRTFPHLPLNASDFVFACVLPFVWVAVLAFNHAYERSSIGVGSHEIDRSIKAFFHTTVVVVFVTFMAKFPVSERFLLVTLGATLAFDAVARGAVRRPLHRARGNDGRFMTSVLTVGGADAVVDFNDRMAQRRYAGMNVIGACLTSVDSASVARIEDAGVHVYGDVSSVLAAVRASNVDRVAVLGGDLGPERLRWIAWQLEEVDVDLVVSPGLTEIAGNRLHVRPVAGLPLLHVDQPEFTGVRHAVKAAFDRSVAAAALILLAPLLIPIGLAVRLGSKGPALFRQTRVGVGGRTFNLYKFRSMTVDAEERLAGLLEQNAHGEDAVLFKMKNDPRITKIGRILRKYSIDELPQLLNVVKGDMSLVGPRPPLPSEVEKYGAHHRRRLLVKPGITGLWQVSGRSDLAWEESVRLELHYVENWSIGFDLVILWKTASAVLRSSGAY